MADEVRMLDKNSIINAMDLERQSMEVPEWGGTVFIRGMTGAERAEFDGAITSARSRVTAGSGDKAAFDIEVHVHKMRIQVCAWCLVDSNGKRLFQDREIAQLGLKSDAALQRIYDKAIAMSGLSPEAEEEAEDFSEPDPDDES